MKKLTFVLTILVSNSLYASNGDKIIKSLGNVYTKTAGTCATYLDIMRWFNYETEGTVSFALTEKPMVRPLEGYLLNATISSKDLLPLGQGIFKQYTNQPVPMKAEFTIEANDGVSLFLHHYGKGSMGGIIFGQPGYSKENHKLEYHFSALNNQEVFEKLELTYHDLKGLRPKKKVFCSYTLAQ